MMPNWTDVTLECEGLSDLPIFTEYEPGKPEFDYNKVTPMPDYVRDTISPVQANSVVCYLFQEFSEDEAKDMLAQSGLRFNPDYLNMAVEDVIAATDKPETLGFGEGATEISAYDLGKNYYTSFTKEGVWDWYEWSYKNWGVKWNACDSNLVGDTLYFMAPWGYPDKVFEKLADMFPKKEFHSEIIYEDDYENIHTIDFSADYWTEELYNEEENNNDI